LFKEIDPQTYIGNGYTVSLILDLNAWRICWHNQHQFGKIYNQGAACLTYIMPLIDRPDTFESFRFVTTYIPNQTSLMTVSRFKTVKCKLLVINISVIFFVPDQNIFRAAK
jgi:hypothetical protein